MKLSSGGSSFHFCTQLDTEEEERMKDSRNSEIYND